MRKLNISVIVGIIVALVGAGLVIAYGRNVNHKISDGKRTMNVLVANESLTAGMAASAVAGHVHIAQIPAAYVVHGALGSSSSLTTATADNAVLAAAVPQGGQLSFASFAQGSQSGRVQPSKGDVALSIQTPLSSGVARYLEPGQLVDMFVTYNGSGSSSTGGKSITDARTKLFASGVKVLAVSVPAGKSNGGDSDLSTPSGSVLVLVDLTPENAEKVVNATTLGTIYLAYTMGSHDTTPTGATPQSVVTSNR